MRKLSVLIACEKSGVVRDVLFAPWDLLIAHPECTYLCGSGWHWVKRGRIETDGRPRIEHVNEALAFAKMFIGPSADRSKERSKTYAGIAEAMADQWGGGLA